MSYIAHKERIIHVSKGLENTFKWKIIDISPSGAPKPALGFGIGFNTQQHAIDSAKTFIDATHVTIQR